MTEEEIMKQIEKEEQEHMEYLRSLEKGKATLPTGDLKKECKLKAVRQKAGFSQRQLSDATGVNFRTLQAYEQGTKVFDHARLETILKICLALDCRMEDVLEDTALLKEYMTEEG